MLRCSVSDLSALPSASENLPAAARKTDTWNLELLGNALTSYRASTDGCKRTAPICSRSCTLFDTVDNLCSFGMPSRSSVSAASVPRVHTGSAVDTYRNESWNLTFCSMILSPSRSGSPMDRTFSAGRTFHQLPSLPSGTSATSIASLSSAARFFDCVRKWSLWTCLSCTTLPNPTWTSRVCVFQAHITGIAAAQNFEGRWEGEGT
eukprot:376225-Rhodomonas_salina.2